MILYSVTVNIEPSVANSWEQYMREEHIPDVMATGYFEGYRMTRLLQPAPEEGVTWNIQYECVSMAQLNIYQEKAAPALQAEHHQKFEGKFVAFRTILEIVDSDASAS
ncbi:MAG: DUF4286 family protein [Bacteroidota bacterium]